MQLYPKAFQILCLVKVLKNIHAEVPKVEFFIYDEDVESRRVSIKDVDDGFIDFL